MAYRLDKYGKQVEDDLDSVENKTIYPNADTHVDGLMTKEHVQRINEMDEEIDENNETLSEFEIRMICLLN
jgi:hypothetical protein